MNTCTTNTKPLSKEIFTRTNVGIPFVKFLSEMKHRVAAALPLMMVFSKSRSCHRVCMYNVKIGRRDGLTVEREGKNGASGFSCHI